MSISERKKELRRRRKRREQYTSMKSKLTKADANTKERFAAKLRKMTPAAESLIADWNLEKK